MSEENRDALSMLRDAKNYWMVNWQIVQHFQSLEEAVILGYLCSMEDYWARRNRLKDGKWFFCTKDDMRKYTTIEARKQKKAIDNLIKFGLIETKNIGCPPTRHFHINAKKIERLLTKDKTD